MKETMGKLELGAFSSGLSVRDLDVPNTLTPFTTE